MTNSSSFFDTTAFTIIYLTVLGFIMLFIGSVIDMLSIEETIVSKLVMWLMIGGSVTSFVFALYFLMKEYEKDWKIESNSV